MIAFCRSPCTANLKGRVWGWAYFLPGLCPARGARAGSIIVASIGTWRRGDDVGHTLARADRSESWACQFGLLLGRRLCFPPPPPRFFVDQSEGKRCSKAPGLLRLEPAQVPGSAQAPRGSSGFRLSAVPHRLLDCFRSGLTFWLVFLSGLTFWPPVDFLASFGLSVR